MLMLNHTELVGKCGEVKHIYIKYIDRLLKGLEFLLNT